MEASKQLERDALVESATKFYLESRPRDALEQFKEVLECLGLLPYMNRHSSLFREVFINAEKPFLAKDIASLFKAVLSPPEGNAYPFTLEKVLIFTSGASAIPRLGFPVEPQLQFFHKQENEAARIFP
ncbi:unnamed protein product [Coregonus sp. 'balchen']|nr:unnamed protein product [Coregonus sp. 'balchen']